MEQFQLMLQRQMMTFEELFLIFLLVKSPMIASRAAVRSVAAVSSFSFSFKRSALSSSEQTVTVVLDIVRATSYKRYQNKNQKILFIHIQTLTFLLLGASEMYLVSLIVLVMTTLQVSALGSEDFDDDVVRLSILAWASFTALSLSARNFASDFKSSGF